MLWYGLQRWRWLVAAVLIAAAGDAVLAQRALAQLREAFETDARIMHRLLSQRASQHDALVASLNLFDTEVARDGRAQRLSALYPQIIAVAQRGAEGRWSGAEREDKALPALDAAWNTSRASGLATTADFDATQGRYWLVRAGSPMGHALLIDLNLMVPWSDWPGGSSPAIAARNSGIRVSLDHGDRRWLLQDAPLWNSDWRFSFRKHLAAVSQPFDVVAERCHGWSDLPWLAMLAWTLLSGLAVGAAAAFFRQRRARERAELLRQMDRVSKLNAMGELAAGMAHELNQPLTAVLANTQAATRMLRESPPDVDTARPAMQRAAEQARRAADVLARLRLAVAQPEAPFSIIDVDLAVAGRKALFLIEPDCLAQGVVATCDGDTTVLARADAVALEQVLHNLLSNALSALAKVPVGERRLQLRVGRNDTDAVIEVIDSGPGIAADVLPRLFEPFFTTQASGQGAASGAGMGLGLSLCDSLLQRMAGSITARNGEDRGAVFRVTLPRSVTSTERTA
ncbi:MAG: two-component sensor histidine kinase [Burkholderiales bacterium]|nr:two-component sensor histidine kinase [Burkholderiales bacterium]